MMQFTCHGAGAGSFGEAHKLQQGTAPHRRKALSEGRTKATDTAGMQQLDMPSEFAGPKEQARKEAYSILLNVQRSRLPQGHTFTRVCCWHAPLHWC